MAKHDGGYKLLFSHREMVEDLLQGFLRERWVDQLDFSTLERVGESQLSADLRELRRRSLPFCPPATSRSSGTTSEPGSPT